MQCERATLGDTTRSLSCFFVTTVCGVITVSTTTTHVFLVLIRHCAWAR